MNNHNSTQDPRGRMRRALGTALFALALFALVGCGGGGSSSSSSSAEGSSHKGASSEFISPGGENKFAKFGEEASEEEREAASAVLEENLTARQVGDWETQCASLTESQMKELSPESGAEVLVKACAKGLGELAQPLSATAETRKDRLPGEIDVLRVKGKIGYALFHGSEGTNYAMAMEKEGTEWKVASLVTVEAG
jgi:hypothetical protein